MKTDPQFNTIDIRLHAYPVSICTITLTLNLNNWSCIHVVILSQYYQNSILSHVNIYHGKRLILSGLEFSMISTTTHCYHSVVGLWPMPLFLIKQNLVTILSFTIILPPFMPSRILCYNVTIPNQRKSLSVAVIIPYMTKTRQSLI